MNLPNSDAEAHALGRSEEATLSDRVATLATWISEIDGRVQAATVATDDKALKELRRTLDAISKRDPKFEERLTNKVDVIADRLRTLATTVATTGAAIAKEDGDIAALRRDLETRAARFDAVESELRRSIDSAGLAELRRTITELSAERTGPKGDDRKNGELGRKLDYLAERVDCLAKTVATTASGLAARDGELAAIRRKHDAEIGNVEGAISELRGSVDPASVQELRAALKTQSDETSALKRANQRGLDAVRAAVGALGGHYEQLARSATASATGVAAANGELAALRTAFDEETGRLDSNVVKLQRTIGTLAAQLAERGVDRETVDGLDDRLAQVSDVVDAMGQRLAALASAVDDAAKDFSDREFEAAALNRRFEEAGSRVDSLVADLRLALETMPGPGSDEEPENRIDKLAERVDAFAGQLERLDAEASKEVASARDAAAGEDQAIVATARALEDRLEGLGAEVGMLHRRFEKAGSRLDAAVAELQAELARVSAGTSPSELEARLGGLAEHVATLGGRLAQLETATSAETARDRARVSALRDRIETIAEATSDDRLEDLVERVDALASQVPHRETMQAQRELEQRLEALASRLEVTERGREAVVAELARVSAARGAEVSSLRDQLDVLAVSQAESGARLDSLVQSAGSGTAALGPGEGSLRLDLRGPGLRLEQVEAAARQNREDLVAQLERLASQIESRFRQLEPPSRGAPLERREEEPELGRLVPIRGEA